MSTDNRQELVKTLVDFLRGGHAHATFEDAVNGLPVSLTGAVPEGLPYSIWQIVEHIRIGQWDMLEFSRNPNHKSPKWPDKYWPEEIAPADDKTWKKSIAQIIDDREAFIGLLKDPANDLYAPFPWGQGQHLLKEAIMLTDHNGYHTGEIIVIRKLLGAWK